MQTAESTDRDKAALGSETERKRRKARGLNWRGLNWRGVVAVLALFGLWHVLVTWKVAGFTAIPSPLVVAHTFVTEFLFNPSYWQAWWISFKRVFYGFALAQVLGIPLGLLLGTREKLSELLFPIFELLRPIPPLAWVPISILFWPTNEASIVFITFIGAFFVIVINVNDGVRTIRNEHIWLAQSLGARPRDIFRRIILPSVIPSIAVGMTLGIAITWNVVIAAEMIASDNGLGRLTWEGYVSSTPPVVVVGMISIGLAGYVSTMIVNRIERKLMPWRQVT